MHTIEIKCDNLAVVEVLRSGKARDQLLASIARNVWLITAMYNVTLIVKHILANLLSFDGFIHG